MIKKNTLLRITNLSLIALLIIQQSFAIKVHLQETQQLETDILYARYTATEFPLNAHVITLPLDTVDIKLVPALGQREEVSSIAKRCNALLAVNGSNYRRGGKYNGNRVNLLYLDKKVYSDLQLTRGSFGWNSKTKKATIDKTFLKIDFSSDNKRYTVDHVNQPRVYGQSVLYTPCADAFLLNHTPGKNIIIADGTVQNVTHDIPEIKNGTYVYQVDSESACDLQKGMPVTLKLEVTSADNSTTYNDYDFVLGGAGLLIHNGTIQQQELFEEFSQGQEIVHCNDEVAADFHTTQMQHWLIDQRHPRTAVGITTNNQLCIVVVEGRTKDSEGISMPELAEFMQNLGCTDALNIGGGGCTTLYLKDTIPNQPSACYFIKNSTESQTVYHERPVSEALCFFI